MRLVPLEKVREPADSWKASARVTCCKTGKRLPWNQAAEAGWQADLDGTPYEAYYSPGAFNQVRQRHVESVTPREFIRRLLDEDDPTNPPTTSNSAKPEDEADVGDDVTVVDGGREYVGKVAARDADGRVKVSFAGSHPARQDFKSNELRRGTQKTRTAAPVSQPQRPVVGGGPPGLI